MAGTMQEIGARIDVTEKDCNEHGQGVVDKPAKCFPEAGASAAGPKLAWECMFLFTVQNVPFTGGGSGLWIAQHLVRVNTWMNETGLVNRWKHVFNEAFPVAGSGIPVEDPHSSYQTFPQWCKVDSTEDASLELITFKSGTEPPRGGVYVWENSAQRQDAAGNDVPGQKFDSTGRPYSQHKRAQDDYRTDPNVNVVPVVSAGYSREYHIDHCKLAPYYRQVIDALKALSAPMGPAAVWNVWEAVRLFKTYPALMALVGMPTSGSMRSLLESPLSASVARNVATSLRDLSGVRAPEPWAGARGSIADAGEWYVQRPHAADGDGWPGGRGGDDDHG